MLVRVCEANNRPAGRSPCVAAVRYVGFACGKLHSFRMPDEQCSSLRPGRRSPSRRGTRFHFMCRDEQCSPAFAKQTIARQGDLPALRRYGTLDLPAAHDGNVLRPSCVEGNATLDLPPANCIRSECRTSIARPYIRVVALRPAGGHVSFHPWAITPARANRPQWSRGRR